MDERRIVCFGDSVTQGTPHVPVADTFVRLLERRFSHHKAQLGAVVSVFNAGAGGENSREGLARFHGDVEAVAPHLVTVEFGLNDIRFEKNKRTSEEEFAENLRQIHTRCRQINARVLFMTPNPIINRLHRSWQTDWYADYGGCNEKCAAYAEVVRTVADETGSALCDIYEVFITLAIERQFAGACADYRDLVTLAGYLKREDGVHPTIQGQEVIARELYVQIMREDLLDLPGG